MPIARGGFWGRHPRSVVGVTRRGEAVMIVVDGRFPGQAAGMTIGELIYLVRQLGLYSALNLDGGGSSTLWCEEAGVVNRPSDNRRFDHGANGASRTASRWWRSDAALSDREAEAFRRFGFRPDFEMPPLPASAERRKQRVFTWG